MGRNPAKFTFQAPRRYNKTLAPKYSNKLKRSNSHVRIKIPDDSSDIIPFENEQIKEILAKSKTRFDEYGIQVEKNPFLVSQKRLSAYKNFRSIEKATNNSFNYTFAIPKNQNKKLNRSNTISNFYPKTTTSSKILPFFMESTKNISVDTKKKISSYNKKPEDYYKFLRIFQNGQMEPTASKHLEETLTITHIHSSSKKKRIPHSILLKKQASVEIIKKTNSISNNHFCEAPKRISLINKNNNKTLHPVTDKDKFIENKEKPELMYEIIGNNAIIDRETLNLVPKA